ncbi:hypothetical protein [Xanthomonas albilineans]|uniref:hypothetical protein n=1 Tax=Xanthomonas albilineans TaxID=29447 RepID=UPI0005F30FED|nr:hypothetical protein [Xanthomonas albilineans]PPU91073.1 hypothetical protein XalbCFBP2523_15415 [Xanthomonas albilineans]
MLIGGAGWLVIFYIIMMASAIMAVLVIPFSMLFEKIKIFSKFLIFSYGIGCIGHLCSVGIIVERYFKWGVFSFNLMFLWIMSGLVFIAGNIIFFAINGNSKKLGYNFYLVNFIIFGLTPTFLFLIFS